MLLYAGLRRSELASLKVIDGVWLECETSKERMGKNVVKRKAAKSAKKEEPKKRVRKRAKKEEAETLWSQIHVGSNTIQVADGLVPASLYYISYWDNRMNVNLNIEGQPTKFVYDNKDYSKVVFDNFYIQKFSDCGLVPVDEELKEAMQAFTKFAYSARRLFV